MLNFPKSTEFGKIISKEQFYENMNVDTAMKKLFVSDIERVVWQNKLSSKTINIDKGEKVIEIDVLEIKQKNNKFNHKIIEFIDRNVPHHTVFVLTFENKGQVCISYKQELANKEGKFKINSFYKTEYTYVDKLQLDIKGLNLDKVYENFILQVAGDKLNVGNGVGIEEAIVKSVRLERLQKEINTLESRVKREQQFNVQVKLNEELRVLRERMEFEKTTKI
jgi:hypothetical protein